MNINVLYFQTNFKAMLNLTPGFKGSHISWFHDFPVEI